MRPFVFFLWLVATGLGAEPVWKHSDSLGNDRGPAPQVPAAKGWFLRIEPRNGGEERTLFHDGREDSVRLVDLDSAGRIVRWQDLRGGVSIWEVTFDPVAGLPLTETLFDGNKPSQVSSLVFEARVLVRRTVRSPGGDLLFDDRLYHWPDGSLRRLERDGPDGPLAEASWTYDAGHHLVGAWSVDEDEKTRGEHHELVYSSGKTEEILASETAILATRVTEALELGGTRETKTEPASDRTEVRTTDAKGRETEEVISLKGTPVQTSRWKYDDQGRILETTVDSAGPEEIWTYVYGDVVEGTLTRDGIIVREESVKDGEKLSVRLYDRGDLFLVETWEAGKRVKETYYQNGVVVRERVP